MKNIFKVDHLKQVYLTKLTDDARKTSAIRGQNRNTSPGKNRSKNASLDFSSPIFISPGVEMKTTGNHIARFKNNLLRKLTTSKIHGAFTCLLTVAAHPYSLTTAFAMRSQNTYRVLEEVSDIRPYVWSC